ncbi:MAG: hypothetical protein ACFB16_02445 [Phormidesmis sp.]
MTQSTACNRAQLEALLQKPAALRNTPSHPQIPAFIRQLGTDLLAFFTGSQTLRVWTSSTKQGVVWSAYDPMSGEQIHHCSESELRLWLESRHRH